MFPGHQPSSLPQTFDEATGSARDALDLRDIVSGEVLITGGIEETGGTEKAPEPCGHRLISFPSQLGTDIKTMARQCAVPQEADPREKNKGGRWGRDITLPWLHNKTTGEALKKHRSRGPVSTDSDLIGMEPRISVFSKLRQVILICSHPKEAPFLCNAMFQHPGQQSPCVILAVSCREICP